MRVGEHAAGRGARGKDGGVVQQLEGVAHKGHAQVQHHVLLDAIAGQDNGGTAAGVGIGGLEEPRADLHELARAVDLVGVEQGGLGLRKVLGVRPHVGQRGCAGVGVHAGYTTIPAHTRYTRRTGVPWRM